MTDKPWEKPGLTEELDRRIAAADALEENDAEALGYDVRAAGRAKHKGLNPYPEDDRRHWRFRQGAARALSDIKANIDKLNTTLDKYRPDA